VRSYRCVHSDEGRPAPRFPLIALLAPLVVSALLFPVLRSGYVLVFALLGPVMALSSWWEARRAHRVETERQREQARARDEEDYQSRVQRDQHHLTVLQQKFPHPSQWVNLPLWRPQHSSAGPSIRVGATTQNGPHGTPLLGLPAVVEAPRGIALVGQPRFTEAVWPACVAQILAQHRRGAPLDITTLWPETGPPASRIEVKSEGGAPLLLQRCEAESDVDERIDHVFTMVSNGAARWFHGGVMQSDTVRLDRLSPHQALWLRNLLTAWFPAPATEHSRPPAPSRDNVVLQWSEDGWKDLVRVGPHAIIWGQSGAGKTILMRTMIHHLSRRYSPQTHQVVIIDFKGASSIGDLEDLPHLVGWVSDLDVDGVQRAYAGITAEIVRREKLFLEHRCR
jgi:S-DNA-T family DNA segregation ATPase FtsK/SpoIIIE